MDRFFASVSSKGIGYIEEDFQHFKVKRVKLGQEIEIIDKTTLKPYLGRVSRIEKRRAEVEILQELPPNVPSFFVRLYQCVPVKISTFDEIVQKATEIGVWEIVPVISKRSFQKASVVKDKIPRWEKIAKEALKQCGRHQPLTISEPVRLEDIKTARGFLNLFPFEREKGRKILEVLKGIQTTPKGANVVIGPEGGFSKEEALWLEGKGFIPVSLGPFVLRAPTAAVVACSTVYNYFW